jgi:hypothetical protein
VPTQFQSEAAGENNDGSFGCGVKSSAGECSAMRGNRGQIDDASETTQLHALYNGARHVNQTVHVDTAHAFHLSEVEIRQVALGQHTGIVYEDVDGAKLAGYALGDPVHLSSVSDIRLQGERTARPLLNQSHNVRGIGSAMMVVHRDRSSVVREPQRNRAT